MSEVLVWAFDYTIDVRYLDDSAEMVRERYSHIETGELGDVATDTVRRKSAPVVRRAALANHR